MKIPTKDAGEQEVDPLWVKEWSDVYYDVPETLFKIRTWCLDNPEKRKTKRGLRRFIGKWIRRDCRIRPQIKQAQIVHEERPDVPIETRVSFLQQMKERLK